MLRFALITGFALSIVAPASAALVTYSVVLDTVTSTYFGPLVPVAETEFTPSAPPLFNATLSGGDVLQVTFSAPAGLRFRIGAPPPGSTSTFFSTYFYSGTVGVLDQTPGVSMTFGGLVGTIPPVGQFNLVTDDTEFGGTATRTGGNVEFSSVTVVYEVPAGYSRTFTDFIPDAELQINAIFVVGQGADPGPLGGLVAIPEPTSLSLLAAAGAAILRRRRGNA